MILTCVLVGDYLSEKEERSSFYVRNGMELGSHIAEHTSEGSDAFQQMYRIEYSAFLKLCTILSPQAQVNDEMSRHRTSMGSKTVEIMLHCLL